MESIDVSNDKEIERLGANATAEHALRFWNQLSSAARRDARELDPLWAAHQDRVEETGAASSHHTKNLVLTENLSFDEETRFYNRFRSNFSPIDTFPVTVLASSFLYGEYTRPKWTHLLEATHGQLMDYNFITLLRRDALDLFWMTETEAMGNDALDELLVVSRAQWLFIELARCREGCYGYAFRKKLEIFDLKTCADEIVSCIQLLGSETRFESAKALVNKCSMTLAQLQAQWPYPTKNALIESGAGKSLNWAFHHIPDTYSSLMRNLETTLGRWRHLLQVGSILDGNSLLRVKVDPHIKALFESFSLSHHGHTISSLDHRHSSPMTTQHLSDLIVDYKDTPKLISTFQSFGIVVIDPLDCIPSPIIQECRSYGNTCLELFQQDFLTPKDLNVRGENEFDFHECRQRPGHRVDNRYKILHPASPILALWQSSPIQSLIQSLFGSGMDYKILYAGIVHSFPSLDNQSPPPAQLWHRDGPSLFASNEYHPTHCMNIFIPLIDVDEHNGCTEFLPGSHCDAIFETHCRQVIQLAEKDPKAQHALVARPQVKAGTILAFDIRVMHRGLANSSDVERPLLYFTVARSWWEEKHMFKETIPKVHLSISNADIILDLKMVGALYKLVTGMDMIADQDYGHPHYTERFDLLLLEDLKSEDEEKRHRGKVNFSAAISFAALSDESKNELMIKWVETLAHTDSQRLVALERNKLLRKQAAAMDFTTFEEDFTDVTALYQLLVDSLFSIATLKVLGFTHNKEGFYVALALMKADCLRRSRINNMSPLPESITHDKLEESLTSWWHGGIGRFAFKGPFRNDHSKRKVLVVFSSLGSGLARPEWNGTLDGLAPMEGVVDVLHVLDPSFSWYQQDPSCTWKGQDYYRNQLKELTSSYDGVMYLGDSMGGAAALLFSDLADHVLAFTPQVTIESYEEVKRKDFPDHLRKSFKYAVIQAVNSCKGPLKIHYGMDCIEDAKQISYLVKNVEDSSRITVVEHQYDDHILSIHLKEKGILKRIVEDEIDDFLART